MSHRASPRARTGSITAGWRAPFGLLLLGMFVSRIVFGSAMFGSIVIGVAVIRRYLNARLDGLSKALYRVAQLKELVEARWNERDLVVDRSSIPRG